MFFVGNPTVHSYLQSQHRQNQIIIDNPNSLFASHVLRWQSHRTFLFVNHNILLANQLLICNIIGNSKFFIDVPHSYFLQPQTIMVTLIGKTKLLLTTPNSLFASHVLCWQSHRTFLFAIPTSAEPNYY